MTSTKSLRNESKRVVFVEGAEDYYPVDDDTFVYTTVPVPGYNDIGFWMEGDQSALEGVHVVEDTGVPVREVPENNYWRIVEDGEG